MDLTNIRSLTLAVALVSSAASTTLANPPSPDLTTRATAVGPALTSGELAKALDRACVLGTVLYVAAHPDDENTHLLSWFVGERNLRAAYVSMTRGGGGQNLIGSEQSELLGLIRTRELLAARQIDGAEQYFTRARDFGYSKTPEETLKIWGKDQALADLVFVIRRLRPDVIVTRFPLNGKTHGHHLASAILGAEAFVAAADPKRFPEQLAYVQPWQATRIVENKPHWRIDPDTDKTGWLTTDVAGYDPLLGHSWDEIAAASRSMHKSQGFGSSPRRGVSEYFVPIAGKPYTDDLFSGIDLSWDRVKGGAAVATHLKQAVAGFDPRHPQRILGHLVAARAAVDGVGDRFWRDRKAAELDRLILAAAGVTIEVRADSPTVVPSRPVALTLNALARTAPSDKDGVTIASVTWPWLPKLPVGQRLDGRALTTLTQTITVDKGADYTIPHWLAAPPTAAAYVIDDPARVGDADDPAALQVIVGLQITGRLINVKVPVESVTVDPVLGERRRDVPIVPLVTASFDRSVLMIPAGPRATLGRQTLDVTLQAFADDAKATVRFVAPPGTTVTPGQHAVAFAKRGDTERVTLTVTTTDAAVPGDLRAEVTATEQGELGRRDASYQAVTLDYPHIPERTVLLPSTLRVVPVALKTGGRRIAYVPGSGDRVAESLRQVGYTVEEVPAEALMGMHAKALSGFDALVFGVRAFNVHPTLTQTNDMLMAYVKKGGRVIVQYQTQNRFGGIEGPLGPASFTLARGRVTDETAAMTPVNPKHPALTTPNALTAADWDGWVQERGLYFADTWDAAYTPLWSAHDPGESALTGATIVARHGRGVFVYTGLSFFRQLPAGVPGAYRLMANLLALKPVR